MNTQNETIDAIAQKLTSLTEDVLSLKVVTPETADPTTVIDGGYFLRKFYAEALTITNKYMSGEFTDDTHLLCTDFDLTSFDDNEPRYGVAFYKRGETLTTIVSISFHRTPESALAEYDKKLAVVYESLG